MFTPWRRPPPTQDSAGTALSGTPPPAQPSPHTTDKGTTVPQRANLTQTACAHPQWGVQAQGQRPMCWIGIHVFLWRTYKNTNNVFRLVDPVYDMDTYLLKGIHETGWTWIEYRILFLVPHIQHVGSALSRRGACGSIKGHRVWEVVRTVAAPPSIVVEWGGVVLRVVVCGVVLVVCCRGLLCHVFVCVTCFSSYKELRLPSS